MSQLQVRRLLFLMITAKNTAFINSLLTEIDEASKLELSDAPLSFHHFMAFFKNGNRLKYEEAYFARRKKLLVSAIYAMTHPDEAEAIERLEEVIFMILQEYTWALPAHVGKNPEDVESVKNCIDLFAAETAQALSEKIHRLKEQLSPTLVTWIKSEIDNRILQPFEKQKWEWESKENNWSAVVAGCIGMSTLRLIEESQRRTQLLDRLDYSFQSFLRGFGEDGACVEGTSYWAYGFGYYVYFASMLEEETGNSKYFDLLKVKEIAAFPYRAEISKDQFIPFGDHDQTLLPTGLLCFIKERLGVSIPEVTEVSPLDSDTCYRFAQTLFTIEHSQQELNEASENQMIHYFSDCQWLIVRDQTNDLFFAARGGRNDESHNHNDLGHFIYGSLSSLMLTDLGAGEYTKDYFDDTRRYNYFVTSASSHSIPMINGQLQSMGDYQATVVTCEITETEVVYILDLQNAYPLNPELQHFYRTFRLNLENAELTIVDDFQFSTVKNEIIENFVTQVSPIASQQNKVVLNQVTLDLPKGSQFVTQNFANHKGMTETAYLIQNHFNVKEAFEFECQIKKHSEGR